MVKRLYIVLLLLIVISTPLSIIKISTNNITNNTNSISNNNYYGKLIIDKINLNEELFPIDSNENTIERHVSILKNSNEDLMIIAAHSGIGPLAYFQELDKLELNDEIILIIENNKTIYIVKDIWEEKKNGYININKENNKQLILTTCSPNKEGYQLVINCIKKESI